MAQMLTPAVDTEAAMCWEGARLIRFQAVNALSAREAKSVLVRRLQVHSVFCHARQTAGGSFHD